MAQKALQYRKKLAAVFASFGILLFGTASLAQSMSIDYYSVVWTIIKITPGIFVVGLLGWVMGMVLDQPRKRRRISYNNILMNDLLKNAPNQAPSESEGSV